MAKYYLLDIQDNEVIGIFEKVSIEAAQDSADKINSIHSKADFRCQVMVITDNGYIRIA